MQDQRARKDTIGPSRRSLLPGTVTTGAILTEGRLTLGNPDSTRKAQAVRRDQIRDLARRMVPVFAGLIVCASSGNE